jgi:phosphatidylinositol alpha-mannosyltransferase
MFSGYFASALNKLAAHIAVSKSAASFVQKYYPATTFHIIPNGIDTTRFNTSTQPFQQFRDGIFTILFVGRLDPRKGARYLFAALPLIAKQLPSFRLLVVGSGWMKNVYDKFISPELLSHVHFAGYVSPEDLPRYYRSADVYCSPATGGESFGIVLLEAMASGLPIVASDIEGYHDVVGNGKEGLLVPPKSPRQLGEAIVRLACSSEERSRMAETGRSKAIQYDWKKVADRVEAVYREVLDPRSS